MSYKHLSFDIMFWYTYLSFVIMFRFTSIFYIMSILAWMFARYINFSQLFLNVTGTSRLINNTTFKAYFKKNDSVIATKIWKVTFDNNKWFICYSYFISKMAKYLNNAYYEALLMYKIILKRLTYLSKSHFMIVTS